MNRFEYFNDSNYIITVNKDQSCPQNETQTTMLLNEFFSRNVVAGKKNLRLTTVSYDLNKTDIERRANRAECEVLLENFSVLEKIYWPFDISKDFGKKDIDYVYI